MFLKIVFEYWNVLGNTQFLNNLKPKVSIYVYIYIYFTHTDSYAYYKHIMPQWYKQFIFYWPRVFSREPLCYSLWTFKFIGHQFYVWGWGRLIVFAINSFCESLGSPFSVETKW